MKRVKEERRRWPRIKHKLPLAIFANGYNLAAITHDISCVGAYCHIDKYIPPFTKVAINLNLPIIEQNNKENLYSVKCKGVVVRTEDEVGGGFNIAVLFNEIKDSQRKKIFKYINQFLPKNPAT